MSVSLTDLDPMTFGKHKGTIMQEVPASYFLTGLNDENPANPL